MQGHLGAFFTEVDPAFSGLPTSRHEAACASGSIALLAASAEIEAGRYDLQAVVGIEQMKTVSAAQGGELPRHGRLVRPRGEGRRVPVPEAVRPARRRVRPALRAEGRVPRRDQPHQLRQREAQPERADAHLVHEQAARALPHRGQPGGGRSHPHRRLLAGDRRRGVRVPRLARLRREVGEGPGHRAGARFRASRAGATTRRGCASTTRSPRAATPSYVLPHVRATIASAMEARRHRRRERHRRDRDARLLHDLRVHGDRPLRHHGAGRELEGGGGRLARDRRQAPDQPERRADRRRATRSARPACASCSTPASQVTGQAGDYQVEGARNFQTLNIGGSGTTSVSFIVGL